MKIPLPATVLLLLSTAAAHADPGFKIPVEFKPGCAYLAKLPKAPANLTMKDFVGCLSDTSRAKIDHAFRKKVSKNKVAGLPANLDELVMVHGDAAIAGIHVRDLVFGAQPKPQDRKHEGRAPAPTLMSRAAVKPAFGLDPAQCTTSCTSMTVQVVGDTRTIGYRASQPGATPTGEGRLLDDIIPGTFPDHQQGTLRNAELVGSGCGPVSAVNMFEWWNMPIYKAGRELTSFDERTEFIADRMGTLDGINYTDDDDLLDFMENYPKELFDAGLISGYPASHAMEGNRAAIKVMLSYVARGYPVTALYATGSESLHWAIITGYENGKLHIANAGDRTLADFYAQWDSWDSLSWYAAAAAELMVTEDTFFAYTGWHETNALKPPRMEERTGANPGYSDGTSTYRWRYCTGDQDDMNDAEHDHIFFNEPTSDLGYCMFIGGLPAFSLTASSSGRVSSRTGDKVTVSVARSSALTSWLATNPGVHCNFFGKTPAGEWDAIQIRDCSADGALALTYTNKGQYSQVRFVVHTEELAHANWAITTTTR